jgi:hypothetical protein
MRAMFTPEELAEMAAADAEIENEPLTMEEIRESRARDRAAIDARRDKKGKKIADAQRAYYEANREKIADAQRAYYEANREKIADAQRAYREANREKIADAQRAYREANREKIADAQRAYREANREKINAYMREYQRKRRLEACGGKQAQSIRDLERAYAQRDGTGRSYTSIRTDTTHTDRETRRHGES